MNPFSRMTRLSLGVLIGLGLANCSPPTPESLVAAGPVLADAELSKDDVQLNFFHGGIDTPRLSLSYHLRPDGRGEMTLAKLIYRNSGDSFPIMDWKVVEMIPFALDDFKARQFRRELSVVRPDKLSPDFELRTVTECFWVMHGSPRVSVTYDRGHDGGAFALFPNCINWRAVVAREAFSRARRMLPVSVWKIDFPG